MGTVGRGLQFGSPAKINSFLQFSGLPSLALPLKQQSWILQASRSLWMEQTSHGRSFCRDPLRAREAVQDLEQPAVERQQRPLGQLAKPGEACGAEAEPPFLSPQMPTNATKGSPAAKPKKELQSPPPPPPPSSAGCDRPAASVKEIKCVDGVS